MQRASFHIRSYKVCETRRQLFRRGNWQLVLRQALSTPPPAPGGSPRPAPRHHECPTCLQCVSILIHKRIIKGANAARPPSCPCSPRRKGWLYCRITYITAGYRKILPCEETRKEAHGRVKTVGACGNEKQLGSRTQPTAHACWAPILFRFHFFASPNVLANFC